MMPNLNPKQMKKMMKKMGMKTEEINADEVIIKTKDKDLIISNPQITKIDIKGQKMFQVQGKVSEEEKQKFSEEDIKMIIDQTECSREEAKRTLEETEDMAKAIMELKK